MNDRKIRIALAVVSLALFAGLVSLLTGGNVVATRDPNLSGIAAPAGDSGDTTSSASGDLALPESKPKALTDTGELDIDRRTAPKSQANDSAATPSDSSSTQSPAGTEPDDRTGDRPRPNKHPGTSTDPPSPCPRQQAPSIDHPGS